MRRKMVVYALLTVYLLGSASHAAFTENVRRALRDALDDARLEMQASDIPKDKTLSVLPLGGDQGGYVESLLKPTLRGAGLNYVEGAEDPFWAAVLKEVEWHERKQDMLDQDTLVTFGRLKGTQMLMYGFVRSAYETERVVYVELELHVSDIATKSYLWGGVFTKREALAPEVTVIRAVNPVVRRAFDEAFSQAGQSLRAAAARIEAAGVKSALIVPLAAESALSPYVTNLAQDMLAGTSAITARERVRTPGEALLLIRNDPDKADAVLSGNVTDLSAEKKNKHYLKDGYFLVQERDVHCEVQIHIRKALTGDVVWSGTFAAEISDPEKITWSDLLHDHWRAAVRPAAWVFGILAALLLLRAFVRSTQRQPR